MPDIMVFILKCPGCESKELVITGIAEGWLYCDCLECQAKIKFALDWMLKKSYRSKGDNGQLDLKL